MIAKPDRCRPCPLYGHGVGFSKPSGSPEHGVAIIGEALGEVEEQVGLQFQGPSGKVITRIISRTVDPKSRETLNRDDFYFGNVIWCRPPDNKLTNEWYERSAKSNCRVNLQDFIDTFKANGGKVLLGLGNHALQACTGLWGIEKLRGYIFDSTFGLPFIGTYHPSYIMKGHFPLARVVQYDLLKALYVARQGKPKRQLNYLLDPSPTRFKEWANEYKKTLEADSSTVLAFDIETPRFSTEKDEEFDPEQDEIEFERKIEDDPSYRIIFRVSFAFRPGEGVSVPFTVSYIDVIRDILGTEGPKTVWNANFDVPRLTYNGAPIRGVIYDAMDAWSFLEPAFPRGLKYCATFFCPDMRAWALEKDQSPAFYSAADSDVLLRCFQGIETMLREQNRWEIFVRHFVQLRGVLNQMSMKGVRVDRDKREEYRKVFQTRYDETLADIQELVPVNIKPKKIYKISEEQLKKRGIWIEGRMIEVAQPVNVENPQSIMSVRSSSKSKMTGTSKSSLEGSARNVLTPSGCQKHPKRRRKSCETCQAAGAQTVQSSV